MSLLQLDSQCCDADRYIEIGYICAKTNICYDGMRPIGSIYWFSLPFIFGITLDVLVMLQMAMFLIVCCTAFFVFRNSGKNFLPAWFFIVCIWAAWLYPTYFVALSDTPASLIFMEAVILLILGMQSNSKAYYCLAGFLLGVVPLLRSSYLYPIEVATLLLVIAVAGQWWHNKYFRKVKIMNWKPLLLLVCVFPISLQYWVNWKYMGEASFITSTYSGIANRNLSSNSAGYDTMLPERGYFWYPACDNTRGVLPDFQAGNWSGISCMLVNRARFYFGSYANSTYLGPQDRNYFPNKAPFSTGSDTALIQPEENATHSPFGTMDAAKFIPVVPPDGGDIMARAESLIPLPLDQYKFSIWLWADAPTTMKMRILHRTFLDRKQREESGKIESFNVLHEQDISLGITPQVFNFPIDNIDVGYLALQLGWFNRSDISAHYTPFYAWGAKLERAADAIGYLMNPNQSSIGLIGQADDYAHQRSYSWLLLLANLLVGVLACFFLWRYRAGNNIATVIFIAAIMAALLVESFLVVPEQRFVQGFLMVVWMLACLYITELTKSGRNTSDTRMPFAP